MFIDFHSDPDHAFGFDVVDAATGESLNGLAIWYADDERGLIRRYLRDASGQFYAADGSGTVASVEERRAIRIVPKGSPMPAKARTWRDDPPML